MPENTYELNVPGRHNAAEKEAMPACRDHVAKNELMQKYINEWKGRKFEPTVEAKRGAFVDAVLAQNKIDLENLQKTAPVPSA